MKYQIDDFTLDTKERTLVADNQCHNVRPKTLAFLLYLAEQPGKIISKQELLDNVWDDVNVDEGVIFQSVREIRQLFGSNSIIQNHPRKGYEFTASIIPLKRPVLQNNARKGYKKLGALIALVLIMFSIAFIFYPGNKPVKAFEQTILVLPVKNFIAHGDYDWLYLGGMAQIISKLDGLPSSVLVYQEIHVPRLMHEAGLEREFDSNDITNVFKATGADIIVESEVYGTPSDYKVVYKFHESKHIKQGVILDDSITSALTKVSTTLAEYIQYPFQTNNSSPNKEFSNSLFAEAMISYETDWQTSISFFESYLALNPESVTALIYLSKLYTWNNRLEQANQLMNRASGLKNVDAQELAHILLVKGRIADAQKNWALAVELYQQSLETLSQSPDWLLHANIVEAKGLAYLKQGLIEKSEESFRQALTIYQTIASPIGINSSRLHLANTLLIQGDIEQGSQLYHKAALEIKNEKLELLYSMLEEYQNEFNSQHEVK